MHEMTGDGYRRFLTDRPRTAKVATEEFGQRNGVPGELLVRITPTKIIAAADIAD